MEIVVRDRASDRGCTGGSEGAANVGPPGEILGGFSFARSPVPRSVPSWPPPVPSCQRENKPFRYRHTAANEPHTWLARLNRNAAARAARGAMMLILKYFLVVGTVLTLGLIALNAHLLPDGSKPSALVIHSATTASLPTVAPNVPAPEPSVAAEPVQAPAKSASPTRRSHHSARAQRRSH